MLSNLRLVHRATYFDECHLSLLAWGQSTQCPAQNRLLVSDSRHQKGVRNFRRIVFHSLFKLKGHVTVSSRSRTSATRAARACAGPAPPQFRTYFEPKIDQRASTNVRSWKKFVRENLKRIIFECSNIRCSSTVYIHTKSTLVLHSKMLQITHDTAQMLAKLPRPATKLFPRKACPSYAQKTIYTPQQHCYERKQQNEELCIEFQAMKTLRNAPKNNDSKLHTKKRHYTLTPARHKTRSCSPWKTFKESDSNPARRKKLGILHSILSRYQNERSNCNALKCVGAKQQNLNNFSRTHKQKKQ